MQSKGESAASGSARNQPRLPPITKRGFPQPTRRDKFSGVLLPALFYAARYTDGPRYIDYIGRTRHPHAACALDTSVAGVDPAPRRVWPHCALARDIAHTHHLSFYGPPLSARVIPPPPLSRSRSRLPRLSRALLPSVYLQSLYSPSACTKSRRQAGSAGTIALAEAWRPSPSPAPSASAPCPALSASRTALDESCATW